MALMPLFDGKSEKKIRCRLCGKVFTCHHLYEETIEYIKRRWKLNFITKDDWVCLWCADFFTGSMYACDVPEGSV